MTRSEKLPISPRAVIQRINRQLAAQGSERLKTYRGGKWESDLGRYYIVDVNRNAIVHGRVDLEGLARELKVLAGYERVEDPEDLPFSGAFQMSSPERAMRARPIGGRKVKDAKKK